MYLSPAMKALIRKIVPQALINAWKRRKKAEAFKRHQQTATRVDRSTLAASFRHAGLHEGAVVMVHASLKGIGYVEGGAETVILALQDVVGQEGTLVFPAFTIRNSMLETMQDSNRIFDAKHDDTTVGAITNFFRKMPGVYRSLHPTHSVAAWGKNAEWLTQDHHLAPDNFGKQTPFGKLLSLNAMLMGIGISYGPVTYYHVFEDLYPEKFKGVYLEKAIAGKVRLPNGDIAEVMVQVHAPEFHATRIEKNPAVEQFIREYLEGKAISKRYSIGDGELFIMPVNGLIEALNDLYQTGKTIYKI